MTKTPEMNYVFFKSLAVSCYKAVSHQKWQASPKTLNRKPEAHKLNRWRHMMHSTLFLLCNHFFSTGWPNLCVCVCVCVCVTLSCPGKQTAWDGLSPAFAITQLSYGRSQYGYCQTQLLLLSLTASLHVEKYCISSSSSQKILGGRLELCYTDQLACPTKPFFLLQKGLHEEVGWQTWSACAWVKQK